MNEKTFTVWITRYALTDGIFEKTVTQSEDYPSMVSWSSGSGQHATYHGEGKDWHRTEESAKKRAEEMRLKKIQSIKKSLAKFEKMNF